MRLVQLVMSTWAGRAIAGVLVVALVFLGVVAPRLGSASPQLQLRTAAVSRGNIAQTVAVSGAVNASAIWKVSFAVDGRIAEVPIAVGQQVKKGAVLAKLDETDLQAALKNAQIALSNARIKYDQTAAGAAATDIAMARAAVDNAQRSLSDARTNTANSVATAEQTLEKVQTAYAAAKTNYASLSSGVVDDSKRFRASIGGLRTGALAVRGELQDALRAGDVTTAYNAMLAAESALGLADSYARSVLEPAISDYAQAVGLVQASIDVLDRALARGSDATSGASVYAGAQQSLSVASARLSTAIDAVNGQIAAAQTSANTAQSALNTSASRSDPNLDGTRYDLGQVLLAFTSETTLASGIKSHTGQVTSSLSPVTDAMNGSLTNAQQAIESAKAQASQSVASSQAALQNAQLQFQKTTGSTTQADIALAYASVQLAQLSVDKATNDLANATLVSPVTGVIASVANGIGESPSNPFTTIAVTDQLVLRGTVGEADVAQLKKGQVATVVVDAIGAAARLTGKVTTLDPVATIQQGVPVYGVDVLIDRPDPQIRSGMSGTATVIVASKQGVLTVPNSAVRTASGQKTIQVLRNGTPETVEATFGISNDTLTEVVSGLVEGDVVVLPTLRTATSGQQQGGAFGPGGGGRQPVIVGPGAGH